MADRRWNFKKCLVAHSGPVSSVDLLVTQPPCCLMTEVLQMPSPVHTEQDWCTPTASPSWRIWGFSFRSQHTGITCRLFQAQVDIGGTCHAQTPNLTGCRLQTSCTGRDHQYVFCVLYWAVKPSPTQPSIQETLTEPSLAPQNSSLWMPEKAPV